MFRSSKMDHFTAAQWQEFELQALFFKLMMSGHPIPPDLIFTIIKQRSFTTQSQQDTEANRCRRTDGKKWRCSRQTSKDSKYCERHMHRGKSCLTRNLVESKPLQLLSQSGSHSNITSLSLFKTNVKDPNFITSLVIESGWGHEPSHNKSSNQQKQKVLLCSDDVMKRNETQQSMRMMYHQFMEESPSTAIHEKRDSWLSLVI